MTRPGEASGPRRSATHRIHGVDVDEHGRCAHYGSPGDVVAIRLPCCGRYYACHACHLELEDHDAERWPASTFHGEAVLCGGCRGRLSIEEYLDSPTSCPRCDAPFNPRCELHHPLYFQMTSPAGEG